VAGNRKGFRVERHGPVKAALTGVAAAGFVALWAGFNGGHDSAAPAADAVQELVAAEPNALTGSPSPSAATATATPAAVAAQSAPVARVPAARKTRGS
jgi:hypothetical protein